MQLNDSERDFLVGICHDSSANAGDALKQMINKDVSVIYPDINLKQTTITETLKERPIIGISQIGGDISGYLVVAYPKEDGLRLMDLVMMQDANTLKEMTDEAKGAMTEFLNIIGGAFLNTMAAKLNYQIVPNPPAFLSNVSECDPTAMSLINNSTDIFAVDTYLKVESEKIGGDFWLVLDKISLAKIMDSIQKQAAQQ